eukprot:SAG31_NODE_23366_length_506_cov_0.567568_2_plen_80_part_01
MAPNATGTTDSGSENWRAQLYYPNPCASDRDALQRFDLAGRFLAKVLIDVCAGRPHQIPIHFVRPLYRLLLGLPIGLADY